jgi:hypothetical protein
VSRRAAAGSIAVNQTGVMSGRLIPLIAPEALNAALKVMPPFRPPGGKIGFLDARGVGA